ncbi:MAG: helix-turn-helix transcriptional regulator [Chitinophagaceae bacterium]|jgi:transcriptional regulator with XRE-family HTH domain|nr:helix-turn-helix transcriptional regulator [Chitinophagaceae bacterium]
MNIGNAIKQVREHFGVSQVELSKKTGLSQTAISQMEKGPKQPSKSSIEKICKAFDIPIAILYVMGMQESDVSVSKKNDFEKLYPAMKDFAIQMIGKRKSKILQ